MKIEEFSMESYDDVIILWRKSGISVGSTDTKEQIKKMLDRNPQLFLVGKIDQNVIGVVMGGFDGRRGYVHHLAVDPNYQKKGYGKIIMDELIARFRKMRVHKIHLFIEKYNKDVVEFYQNLGWEIRDDLIMMSYIPDKSLYKMKI
ncbi:MAG: GNAT family N-acetyltransferase [Promethearchaeota archaeon]